MILAGDIGGTNTRLALFHVKRGGRLAMRERAEAKNAGRADLGEIIIELLDSLRTPPRIAVACLGVAGPVQDGRAELTNLNWTVDERKLSRQLRGHRVNRVMLINDLVAHAEGINLLRSADLVSIQKGKPQAGGNRAIIAPGTGLGEGALIFDQHDRDYHASPSEGGHCDFAPTNERDDAMMRFIRARTGGRCSWEDVLSGPGLRLIFDFLISSDEHRVRPSLDNNDPDPADITRAANAGTCKACIAAVEMFADLCGAEAGNTALKFLATAGVYLGGGIPPKILKFLKRPSVRTAFARKGPANVNELLRAIPIHVIKSDDNALFGAAHRALRSAL
jgi:glucokinase